MFEIQIKLILFKRVKVDRESNVELEPSRSVNVFAVHLRRNSALDTNHIIKLNIGYSFSWIHSN